MGDKAQARQQAKEAGVPVLAGSDSIDDPDKGREIAHKIGYPIIIKSIGGGGGKGMRIVHTDASFFNAFMMAQAEALAAFGTSQVYIEKYLEEPKHVEVQILGDEHGNIIHLGERDCSIQRRHQKLIEEAPCTAVTPQLRKKLGEAALKLAKQVGYFSAGTVEFLLDKHKFYFIEMNTRIQVEHPVTEMVTGVDLVKEQIRIAAGEPLRYKQNDIKINGHAIECRINAENPDKDFAPCPGKITGFNVPGGPWVRVDTATYTNHVISPYYDSMIAKLIVWGNDREEAITRMRRSLREFVIQGVKNTIPLCKRISRNVGFLRGNFSTRFMDNLLK
jgi:acetyl-CoA carboxylase biotin carboxylase subunit